MTEPTYEQQRIYRATAHEAFAFTEATPIKKLDAIVGDVANDMATPEVRALAVRLRDNLKDASREKRGKAIKFSEKSALELLCRIAMLIHHLEHSDAEHE
jgi:hypothetical protein